MRSNAREAKAAVNRAAGRRAELLPAFWEATQGEPTAYTTKEAFRRLMTEVHNISAELVNAALYIERIEADAAEVIAQVRK